MQLRGNFIAGGHAWPAESSLKVNGSVVNLGIKVARILRFAGFCIYTFFVVETTNTTKETFKSGPR
jgi:hypothetical protein